MEIVAGFGLKGKKPYVWDQESPYYLSELKAVMISYADFYQMPKCRRLAMEQGLHQYLGIPKEVKIYLDNGAFYFLRREGETCIKQYEEFVSYAKPDWYPIPQDFIPTPKMTLQEQKKCFKRTMQMNLSYKDKDQYVPVIHVGSFFSDYIESIKSESTFINKNYIALGGIVPNLLRAPKAIPHQRILDNLKHTRQEFKDKKFHVFGIGGTATLHIAGLLKIDSVDSSGWRNRAARGIIQLPGTGERIVADLGSWKGRRLSPEEEKRLAECQCPACDKYGIEGLKKNGGDGFCNRATHNLWVLLKEAKMIEQHLTILGDYENWYKTHLDNTTYRPLIDKLVEIILLNDNLR